MSTAATKTRPPTNGVKADSVAIDAILDREVTFVPFMAKDPITLNARMVLNFLCAPTKSGKVCDERQAVRFVKLCQARGLNPWEGDAYLVGFDSQDGPQFSLITAHQAFLKRAEVHPEYDGMESGVLVRRVTKDGELLNVETVALQGDFFEEPDALVGGWATVHFKGRKYPMHKRLKLSVFNTDRSRWKKDPGGMIVKCAEADALRSAFPNSLGGMYLDDELQIDFTPAPTRTEGLANRLMQNAAKQLPEATTTLPMPTPRGETQPAEKVDEAGPVPDMTSWSEGGGERGEAR